VAAFLFAATGVSFIVAFTLFLPNTALDRLWDLNKPGEAAFRAFGTKSAFFLLLLGAGTFAAAAGLLQRKRWAWWFAVLLFSLNACGDLVNWIVTGDARRSASGLLIAAVFLYALSRPDTRRYFKPVSDFARPRAEAAVRRR
jgi:hypothetical protein